MEARAQIPVSLPHPHPTKSYWQDPPDEEIADFLSSPSLPETVVDTVIIGSGITGAATAWNLLGDAYPQTNTEKIQKVLMLEARQVCSGATGRNGGHTKAASYRSFPSTAQTHSIATAITIARLEYANIKAVHTFARDQYIDCDLFSGDTVDVFYDEKQWEQAVKAVHMMRDAMPHDLDEAAKYDIWSAKEVMERSFVNDDLDKDKIKGAISYAAGSLSAYRFVVGVLKLCLELGLELYTHTPALKLCKDPAGMWTIETNRGTVKTKRVVLATNGYTAYLDKRFQGSIVPLRGQITAHRPPSDLPTLTTTYSFIYANGYEYMIPRPHGSKHAGDIVIGGGLVKALNEGAEEFGTTDDSALNKDISEYLTATTPKYFGQNWGADSVEGRVRKEWTGIMGYSGDGFPFVGKVPGEKALWVAASFQGHGMVLFWLCAKALAAMINGREESTKTWFPEAFQVTEERLKLRFMGRLHTKPMDDGAFVDMGTDGE